MNDGAQQTTSKRWFGRSLVASGVLALSVALVPSFAEAGDDKDYGYRHRVRQYHKYKHREHHARPGHHGHHGRHDAHRRHDRHHDHRDHVYRRQHRHRHHGYYHHRRHNRHFEVPRHIHHRHVHVYRPYYWRRVYFAPHGHYHIVYRFPVYTDYGVYYDFYPYCGGELYVDGIGGRISYHGRRIHVDIGF